MGTYHTSQYTLPDEAATLKLAAGLAQVLSPGLVITLQGDLGAGKTTFTRGVLAALGYKGKVKSPTYTLLESYPFSAFSLHHFDLYRFADPEEWEEAGFRDYFNAETICLVEWPDRARGHLPTADLQLELEVCGQGRHAQLTALTELGSTCLKHLSTQADVGC